MTTLEAEPVRVLTAQDLGDTLLEELAVQFGDDAAAAPSRRTAAKPIAPPGALAKALRAAIRNVLGAKTRLVAVDQDDRLVDRTVMDVVERVPPIVHARRDRLTDKNIEALVDAYLATEPTARARHAIEHDNARERARFVEETACLTSRELAALASHTARNPSATGARWKKARQAFALPWRGSDLFPAFQFSEGKPLPVIAEVLAALPEMSPWQTALWFTSSNSWLGGATPADRLGETEQVVEAARREAEALGG